MVLLLCLSFYAGKTQHLNTLPAISAGRANLQTLNQGLWSSLTNPAGLLYLKTPRIGLHSENRFLIKELNFMTLAGGWGTAKNRFFSSVSYFGYHTLQWTDTRLGYARLLTPDLKAGISLNLHHRKYSQTLPASWMISADIGMILDITSKWSAGVNISNPTALFYSQHEQLQLPLSIEIGSAYQVHDQVALLLETGSNETRKIITRGGIEIEISERFYLRGGINNTSILYSFGSSLIFKPFIIDLAFSGHEHLGYSPSISISYAL